MSISGVSPALGGQHLLRTGSLAAVTSGYQEASAGNRPACEASASSATLHAGTQQVICGILQAALVRSDSERHLQRGTSPGVSPAADLPSASAFGQQRTSPTANSSQPAERDPGLVATAMMPAVQHLGKRLPADGADCAPQLDRMGSSDQAHDVVQETVLPAAQAAAGGRDAAGIRRLEVRMVPATKEVPS